MKYTINRQVAAVGMTWVLLLGLLTAGFVAVGAAQVDRSSGHVANEQTVDANGPATVNVSLEAVTDTSLDTDPLEVTTYVIDNETGDVVDNQTASLNSAGTATHSYDVEQGAYDVEVVTTNESQATTYLSSSTISTTEDRVSGHEVNSSAVNVTNSTELAYADLTTSSDASSNTTVTLELTDDTGTVVGYETIDVEPDSTASAEIDVVALDLDPGEYTATVYTADSTSGGLVTVDEIGTTESTTIPVVSGISDALGVSVGAVLVGLVIVAGFLYSRR